MRLGTPFVREARFVTDAALSDRPRPSRSTGTDEGHAYPPRAGYRNNWRQCRFPSDNSRVSREHWGMHGLVGAAWKVCAGSTVRAVRFTEK
jgi:hypothetical protein